VGDRQHGFEVTRLEHNPLMRDEGAAMHESP